MFVNCTSSPIVRQEETTRERGCFVLLRPATGARSILIAIPGLNIMLKVPSSIVSVLFCLVVFCAQPCFCLFQPHRLRSNTKSVFGQKSTVSYVREFILSTILASTIFIPIAPNIALAEEEELTTRQKIIRGTETFLTNPVLEVIRKIDQLDPDEKSVEVNKAILLIPIVDIIKDVETVATLLTNDPSKLLEAQKILSQNKFDTPTFKKIFNRYSDNIFYVDSRRANLYLGGGATPNSLQTQQYLYRNAALTSISNVRDDVKSLLIEIKPGNSVSELQQSIEDTADDCREALEALRNYVQLADQSDFEMARGAVYSNKN